MSLWTWRKSERELTWSESNMNMNSEDECVAVDLQGRVQ